MPYPKFGKSIWGAKCYYLSDDKRIRFKYRYDKDGSNWSKYFFEVKEGLFWKKIGDRYHSNIDGFDGLKKSFNEKYKDYMKKIENKKVDPFFQKQNKITEY
jgi:hypothetical protein